MEQDEYTRALVRRAPDYEALNQVISKELEARRLATIKMIQDFLKGNPDLRILVMGLSGNRLPKNLRGKANAALRQMQIAIAQPSDGTFDYGP